MIEHELKEEKNSSRNNVCFGLYRFWYLMQGVKPKITLAILGNSKPFSKFFNYVLDDQIKSKLKRRYT